MRERNMAQGYPEVNFEDMQGYGAPTEVEHQSIIRQIEKKYKKAEDVIVVVGCIVLIAISAYVWLSDLKLISTLSDIELKVRVGFDLVVTVITLLFVGVLAIYEMGILEFKGKIRKRKYTVVRCKVVDCDVKQDKNAVDGVSYNFRIIDMFRQCSNDTLESDEEIYNKWKNNKNALFVLARFGSDSISEYELFSLD